MNAVNIDVVKAFIAKNSVDAQKDVAESAAARIDHLQKRRQDLTVRIDRAEDKTFALQVEMAGKKGDDLEEIQAKAQRSTAELQRDQPQLEAVRDEEKEQYDAILKQEAATSEAFRAVQDIDEHIFEVIQQ